MDISVRSNEEVNKIVEENDGLAFKFAKQFCIENRYASSCFDFDDCVQCARLGLIAAAKKYKPELGTFSNYAWYWMFNFSFRQFLANNNNFKLNQYICDDIKNGSVAKIKYIDMKEYANNDVDDLLFENDVLIEDTIMDEKLEQNGEDTVTIKAVYKAIRDMILTLNSREAYVLVLRFGLDGSNPRTLENVGGILGVSKDRIRQIEAKALRKLRHPIRLRDIGGGIVMEYAHCCLSDYTEDIEHIFHDVIGFTYEQFMYTLFFDEWIQRVESELKKQGFTDTYDIEREINNKIKEMHRQTHH